MRRDFVGIGGEMKKKYILRFILITILGIQFVACNRPPSKSNTEKLITEKINSYSKFRKGNMKLLSVNVVKIGKFDKSGFWPVKVTISFIATSVYWDLDKDKHVNKTLIVRITKPRKDTFGDTVPMKVLIPDGSLTYR